MEQFASGSSYIDFAADIQEGTENVPVWALFVRRSWTTGKERLKSPMMMMMMMMMMMPKSHCGSDNQYQKFERY